MDHPTEGQSFHRPIVPRCYIEDCLTFRVYTQRSLEQPCPKAFTFMGGSTCLWAVWHYGLWSFQTGGTKLERFLRKNQNSQRKLLNFENWINGEVSKVPKFDFQTQFSISKIIRIFLIFFLFFIEEYQFRSTLFVIDIFW